MACASLLNAYLDFFYAKEILRILPDVIQQKCEGCQLDSLSQTDHTCQDLTKRQQLTVYLEDILPLIDEQDILSKWKAAASILDEVSPEYIAMFELKLRCVDWRTTMKTLAWKERMIRMAVQLSCLERCWPQ